MRTPKLSPTSTICATDCHRAPARVVDPSDASLALPMSLGDTERSVLVFTDHLTEAKGNLGRLPRCAGERKNRLRAPLEVVTGEQVSLAVEPAAGRKRKL